MAAGVLTYGEAFARLQTQEAGILHASRTLFEFVAARPYACAFTEADTVLSEKEVERLNDVLLRRRAHEPIQYITGQVEFCGLNFGCVPGVFIPRPETEEMVAFIESQYAPNTPLQIADICCGTGCIGIALANHFVHATVDAVDIDPHALTLAEKNARSLGVSASWHGVLGDLCALLGDNTYDIVVSNPPYIPSSVMDELPAEVKDWEPIRALEAGKDGLEVFYKLQIFAAHLLKPQGLFCVELHEDCVEKAASELEAQGVWQDVTPHLDISQKSRFISARKK